MQLRCLVAAALFVLGACAALDPQYQQVSAVDGLMAEAVHVSRAPAAEQKAALAAAERAFSNDRTRVSRLRLATLLATLPRPLRDDRRAAELLQPLADPREPGYGRFAALLAGEVGEHARLVREADQVARDRERMDKERDKREEGLRQQL